jgi:hypothetical protein
MLEVAYPYPPRLLSQSIAFRSRPGGRPTTRLSPPEHTRLTDRAESALRTSENHRVDDRQVERACRGREPGPTDPGVADRDGRVHLGVTARRTPPESRWRRRGRGSSMSHAWAMNGPFRMANAGYPRLAMNAPGCLNARLQPQRPRLPNRPCEFDSCYPLTAKALVNGVIVRLGPRVGAAPSGRGEAVLLTGEAGVRKPACSDY